MTEKSERIVVYVTPDTKRAVENQADAADESVAQFSRAAINHRLKAEQQDEILRQTNAEQRIEALIAQAKDEIEESTEELDKRLQNWHEMIAIQGTYSIASFRLLGKHHSDPERRTAIDYGSDRLNERADADITVSVESDQTEEESATDLDDLLG